MSNLNSNLEALFSKMENFISTKTVVGEPTVIDGVIIVPLVDVAFGVGAGSTESTADKNSKDNSAGGLGAKISPSAIMVIQDGNVQLVNVKNQNSLNKLIDMVPGVVSKLNFSFGNKAEKEEDVTFEDERISE